MKVRFTASARRDFLARLQYFHRENPPAAIALRGKVEERLRRLERFPGSGRRIPEFPDLPYREVIVKPFRFFYRVEGEVVWIVALWHEAQIPDEP